MQPPPNGVYTAFSFIGFLMCAIPMYWHLEAWNMGTCMYMAWTGLACLIQCINSIIWNKNMINRAPVYCDIVTRIQIAQNVAVPICSLCIQRRLYKIASPRAGLITHAEKRRGAIIDLLICLGIPFLQMVAQYVVSDCRYLIFEDIGPAVAIPPRVPTIPLISAWPVAIGCVTLVYCVMNIYNLYKRQHQLSEIMSSNSGLNRWFYIRLMMVSGTEIFATIPLGSWILATNIKAGLGPWVSWADVHSNYSHIPKVPSTVWRREWVHSPDVYRWLTVLCAFVFFAFFGFADEARQNYRCMYRSLVSLFAGISFGRSHATSSPHLKSKAGGIMVSVVKSRARPDSTVSISGQLSVLSISSASESNTVQVPLPEPTALSSVSTLADGSQDPSHQLSKTTYPSDAADTV